VTRIPVNEQLIIHATRYALGQPHIHTATTNELNRIWPELSFHTRSEITADIIIAAPRIPDAARTHWKRLITLGIGNPPE
jgi:hypothetical protein